jgi:pimeloyl-ACP methyl ester carboxylesterase
MKRRREVLGLMAATLAVRSSDAAWAKKVPVWETIPPVRALPATTSSGYVVNDGARIYYATFGRGPPVILLHGGFGNTEVWGNQIPALLHEGGYQVIAIDSRGHGRSSRDARPLTYELMASDVVAVMDHLILPKAAVVGWSDGAIVGLVLAIHNPDRLTGVFAFAANMDPSGVIPGVDQNPMFVRFMAKAARDYRRLSPTPDDFAGFQRAVEHMWDTEPNYTAADLARISVPVAIVDGDHDEAIKREHTEYLARSIPGARLIILPRASHFAMFQQPGEFNDAMLTFLGPAFPDR